MTSPDERIARVAERRHNVFTRGDALACGLSERQIYGRVRRGLWLKRHPGVYSIRGAPTSFEAEVTAAVLAGGAGACASHRTAAALWNLDAVGRHGIEISLRDRGRRRVSGVVVHVPRTLRASDVTRVGPIAITSPARTLIDLAGSVDRAALEDALDDAVRRELVSPAKLLARLARTCPNGRRGILLLHALVAERVGKRATGSRLENTVKRAFAAAGVPAPVHQYEIRAPDGSFVARVDFAYPDARLAIEVDGYAYHSGRRRWEYDSVRQNRLVSLGWLPLRITSRQIRERPQEVISLVWRHLATAEVGRTRQTAGRPGFGEPQSLLR